MAGMLCSTLLTSCKSTPRIDGEQRLLVEFDGRQQNALDVARQNDAGIHELAAFDARYHPNDRVVIGEKRVHAGLP